MTWLGKIFAFVVLVLSVATVWLIATTWVTRTNWKAHADEYKRGYQEVVKARQAEYDAYRSEVESLRGQVTTLKAELASAQTARDEADRESKTHLGNLTKVNLQFSTLAKSTTDLDTRIQAGQAQNEEALRRSVGLENDNTSLIIARTTAERERIAAESARRRAEGIADTLSRRVEELGSLVASLRQSGGDPRRDVERFGGAAPVPVPENLRGTVTHVQDKDPQTGIQGELIQISLGIDAGLQRGAVLDVQRESNGGKYLGTLVVDTVGPKYAVGVFRPASGQPFRRLKADEFPKVGDTVKVRDDNATTRIGTR